MNRATLAAAASALAALCLVVPARAQDPAPPAPFGIVECGFVGGDPAPLYLDGLRHAELHGQADLGPLAVVRGGSRRRLCAGPASEGWSPNLSLHPVSGLLGTNSAYPRDVNNGLRWAGKGVSTSIRAGATLAWGPVSAAIAPVFAYQANAPFDILEVERPGSSPYAWYWHPTTIDWPQRFGQDDFWWADPGESYLRADAFGAAIGVSTESLRWGPGRRYPILMSGTAPGFPHVFLGTSTPANVGIGDLAVEAIWGRLTESDYFNADTDDDHRLLAGLVLAFRPAFPGGLTLGFARAYLRTIPPDGWDLRDYLFEPYSALLNNPRGGTFEADNELFSFFGRWVLPDAGFEVYGEFARDDQWDGWDDLLKEIDHAAAVLVGVQKLTPLGRDTASARELRIVAEAVSTNFPETQRSTRHEVIFYTHSAVSQGYTHRGQLLGAAVGPGGDAQYVAVDVIDGRWMLGLYGERVRFAKDTYYQALGARYTYKGHDLELTGGLRGTYRPLPGLLVLGEIAWSGRYNRGWVDLLGPYTLTYERNLNLQIGASWTPTFGRSTP